MLKGHCNKRTEKYYIFIASPLEIWKNDFNLQRNNLGGFIKLRIIFSIKLL